MKAAQHWKAHCSCRWFVVQGRWGGGPYGSVGFGIESCAGRGNWAYKKGGRRKFECFRVFGRHGNPSYPVHGEWDKCRLRGFLKHSRPLQIRAQIRGQIGRKTGVNGRKWGGAMVGIRGSGLGFGEGEGSHAFGVVAKTQGAKREGGEWGSWVQGVHSLHCVHPVK
jgi:hypothetical protein